jgi:predicted RNA-binding protein (virulence factor B family)
MEAPVIEIGRHNTLTVRSLDERGALLGAGDEQVLLPASEIEFELQPGQEIEVFVYTTNHGPTATLSPPALELGGFAWLEVVAVGEHGAFVDWGLPKDLLVPFGNQYAPMEQGRRYVVGLRLHRKTMRLVGTTVLSGLFDDDVSRLNPGDPVDLMVYGRIDQGYQVIVAGRHAGLVYRDQAYRTLRYGDTLRGWVDRVRDDHRLDIVLQRPGRAGIDDACSAILAAIDAADGTLPLHDKSSPEAIQRQLQMSKKAFKKAVGRLYKARLIELDDQGIRRKS